MSCRESYLHESSRNVGKFVYILQEHEIVPAVSNNLRFSAGTREKMVCLLFIVAFHRTPFLSQIEAWDSRVIHFLFAVGDFAYQPR